MATQLETTKALDLVRFDRRTAIGTNPLVAQSPAKQASESLSNAGVTRTPQRRRRTKPWILSPSIINPGEWMLPEALRTRN